MLYTLSGLLAQRVDEFRSGKSEPIFTVTLDRAPCRKAKRESEEHLPCAVEEEDEHTEEPA